MSTDHAFGCGGDEREGRGRLRLAAADELAAAALGVACMPQG